MDKDLYEAAVEGNIGAIEKLSEKIGQVTEEDGRTILHLASEFGKTECMQFIVTQFANENFLVKADKYGGTALHWAVRGGQIDAVELLINDARSLQPSSEFEKFIGHSDCSGDTALHYAVYANQVEAVKLIVKADPNHKYSLNNLYRSPLYMAVELGYKHIVKVILESCTFPSFGGPRGRTPLHAAVRSCDIVELLINGARGFLPPSEFEEFIRHADEDGDTALHHAVYQNQVEAVKLLLNADPNHNYSQNDRSESPLYIAVEKGYKDIVKVILESCAFPSFGGPGCSTILLAAVQNRDIVELLINAARGFLPSSEFEEFIRQADWNGNAALHHAVYQNKVEAVKLLLKADPNHNYSQNDRSESPLYIAAKQGYKDIVKVICESCTSPSFGGPHCSTALHAAVQSRDIVELLINAARGFLPSSEFQKFIRQADWSDDTALHRAVYQNKVEAVKLLVKADPNHKYSQNDRSESPLYIAAKQGYKDIVKVICESCTSLSFGGPGHSTALHAAVQSRDIVESLIDAARGFLPSSEFEKFIREADGGGDTALHLAVYQNQVESVKLLVEADPNHTHPVNDKFESLLYIAVKRGYKDILKVMCESCTSPSFDGPDGKTALHIVAESGDTDFVRVMVEKRGDLVLKRDENGWTAADCAASGNFLATLDILIKTENNQFHDYSVYKQFFMDRPRKETGFHIAACKGHISTILQIMKLYPDFIWSAINEYGQNILHIAVDGSHKELVQAILQYCPDFSQILNTKDDKGNAPLHLLVMRGCFILELITHAGLDRNAKNNDNYTPYDLLYVDQEIVVDQLKIKEALEDSEFINQRWNFGLKKSKKEIITAESPVFPSMRHTKDAKFKKARDLLIKEEIKLYRARINTQIIVTALITTVTFTVGFTMPGGYHQSGEANEGSAVLSKTTAFSVFMLADTLALLLSLSSLALYFVASMYQDAEEISKLVDASTLLNIVSVVATMLTFVMGIYVVLPHSSALVVAVSVMSGFFLVFVILLMIKVMKDPVEKFRE